MKPLTDFMPEVMPSVPGCPVPLAINAVRSSVIEFLEQSSLLEQTQTITLSPDEIEYGIDCDSGTKPVNLIVGFIGGRRIEPIAPGTLEVEKPNWRSLTGDPITAFMRNGLLVVVPRPVVVCDIDVTFTYSMLRNATRVDDVIYENWLDTVVSGALRKLLSMPATPWANNELAVYHKSQFEIGIGKACIANLKGQTTQSSRVTPRPFC